MKHCTCPREVPANTDAAEKSVLVSLVGTLRNVSSRAELDGAAGSAEPIKSARSKLPSLLDVLEKLADGLPSPLLLGGLDDPPPCPLLPWEHVLNIEITRIFVGDASNVSGTRILKARTLSTGI